MHNAARVPPHAQNGLDPGGLERLAQGPCADLAASVSTPRGLLPVTSAGRDGDPHGRAHALVGSVADAIVRRCPCPVLAINPDWAGVRGA
jgi:hypothetical protein